MNYLAQILAFNRWREVNPLPASAIALWHELMAVCNKAGWQQVFTTPNGTLQAACGLSRREFDRARQILIENDRIKYKKSERVNQAGRYEIIPLPIVQNVQQNVQQKGHRTYNGRDNKKDTLYKQETETEIIENMIKEFTANPLLIDALQKFSKMRNKIKKSLSEDAVKLLFRELNKLASTDEEKIAILDRSIMNGWQGVFALPKDQQSQPPQNDYSRVKI